MTDEKAIDFSSVVAITSLEHLTIEYMSNYKLTLEYDGTQFCGWQIQPNVRTVQGDLEKALTTIFQHPIRTNGAGRTDAGVHARGQVANFRHETDMTCERLQAALNGTLARDVRIMNICYVDDHFHARHDARKREYTYRLSTTEHALDRLYTWFCRFRLELKPMQEAATYLVGTHNFQSFCQAGADVTSYMCHIEDAKWSNNGDQFFFCIVGDHFLHNMVRIIIGTMVEIGRGKLLPTCIPDILAACDRRKAGPTAPAKGLCLEKVYYDI